MFQADPDRPPAAAQAREQPAATTCEFSADPEPAREAGAFDALVREIGRDGACEVRSVFWSETSARLKLFGELALEPHRAKIEREAHSLKSAARTFGYQRLASLALRLEGSAAALSEAEYRGLLRRMAAAYAAALEQDSHG